MIGAQHSRARDRRGDRAAQLARWPRRVARERMDDRRRARAWCSRGSRFARRARLSTCGDGPVVLDARVADAEALEVRVPARAALVDLVRRRRDARGSGGGSRRGEGRGRGSPRRGVGGGTGRAAERDGRGRGSCRGEGWGGGAPARSSGVTSRRFVGGESATACRHARPHARTHSRLQIAMGAFDSCRHVTIVHARGLIDVDTNWV